jgi:hypothetical protein
MNSGGTAWYMIRVVHRAAAHFTIHSAAGWRHGVAGSSTYGCSACGVIMTNPKR